MARQDTGDGINRAPMRRLGGGLRLVEESDYQDLYHLLVSDAGAHRWRFRGHTPDPRAFVERLWQGVIAQFIVCDREGAVRGLVSGFDAAFDAGIIHIGVVLDEATRGRGWPALLVGEFIDYLFDHWPFRKIYARIPGYNEAALDLCVDIGFSVEGRLRDYDFFGDRFWDETILAIDRERWWQVSERFRC